MPASAALVAGFLLLLSYCLGAQALESLPTQVGGFSAVESDVRISYGEGEDAWERASVNHPVASGARIFGGPSARAEIRIGPNTLRLGGQALLDVVTLEERALQFRLEEGALSVALRALPPGAQFEVVTPSASVRFQAPGKYRVDVTGAETIRVMVRSGEARVGYRDSEIPLNAGQGVTVSATELIEFDSATAYDLDEFDRWAYAREAEEGGAYSGNVPRYVTGHEELDRSGTWSSYSGYGTVWTPGTAYGWWSPYTYGHWAWVPPWGWSWVDDAPWAFATFRIGHWTFLQGRWWWVPGGFGARPIITGFVPFYPGQIIFTTSYLVHGKPAHHFVPLKPKKLVGANRTLHQHHWRRNAALPVPATVMPGALASPAAPGSSALRSQTTVLPSGIVHRGGADSRLPGIPAASAPPGSAITTPAFRRGPAAQLPAPVAAPVLGESAATFRRGAPGAYPWRPGVRGGDLPLPASGAGLNPRKSELPAAMGGGLAPRNAAGIPFRGDGGSARQGEARSQGAPPLASPSRSSGSGSGSGRGGGGRR